MSPKIAVTRLVLEDLRQVHPETYLSLRSLLSWEPEEDLMADELLDSAAEVNSLGTLGNLTLIYLIMKCFPPVPQFWMGFPTLRQFNRTMENHNFYWEKSTISMAIFKSYVTHYQRIHPMKSH